MPKYGSSESIATNSSRGKFMDIFQRNSAQRPEDQAARRLIERNRGTIERLADQISNGAYSASRKAAQQPAPQASGKILSDLGGRRSSEVAKPYVRISPNRRVVVVDDNTSRQMHHLGDLRRVDGKMIFVLATAENGFFSPLTADMAERLSLLDGVALDAERTEATLAVEIGTRLGY